LDTVLRFQQYVHKDAIVLSFCHSFISRLLLRLYFLPSFQHHHLLLFKEILLM
jgi:hypothetical protein